MSVHYPSGQGPDNLHYVETISRYEPELIFSSHRVNENAMQPGQEQFLVDNSGVGGSLTVPHSARREQRYQMRGEENERQVTFHPLSPQEIRPVPAKRCSSGRYSNLCYYVFNYSIQL